MHIFHKVDLPKLAPLFAHNRYDKVILYSILEGYHGTAMADSLDDPKVARLDSGSHTILGGDPTHPAAEALLLARPMGIVTPENDEWRQLLHRTFNGSISQIDFTECYSNTIKVHHLDDFINMLPSSYKIQPIDRHIAEQIAKDQDNEYFLEHFESVNDFLVRGIGFCILNNEQIVSVATSIAACQHAIDIEIKTSPDYQRTGLGTIIGASLVKGCLEKDIDPKWLAANDRSCRLAEKLGYTRGEQYISFMIGD
ncbi:MAG: GNAT family N-acetyltransferase [Clostridia bacterium]|nr:GNAT family N-acetyltransferase [Clostridia bacterium]